MYYRYELYEHGNKHTAGILSDAEATGIERLFRREYDELTEYFNKQLPVPPYGSLGSHNEAFFTEDGYKKFGPYAKKLARLIEMADTGWKAELRVVAEVPDNMVQYRDLHQIIVRKEVPDMGEFNLLDFIMQYEGGELTEDETIEGFQELIDNGIVWSLQGHYGRTAAYLIEEGYCTAPERRLDPEEIAFKEAEEDAL